MTENLINLITNERPHIEIMKRSGTLLKFLARNELITTVHLESLWNNTQGKHDSYVRATFNIIIELCAYLKEEHNDFLFQKMHEVPIEKYDDQFLVLVKDFTIHSIQTAKRSAIRKGTDLNKYYGLPILKSLMLDSSPLEFHDLATKFTCEILSKYLCKDEKNKFFKESMCHLQQNESVCQVLKLLQKLLKSTDANKSSQEIIGFQTNYMLKELVIQGLESYVLTTSADIDIDFTKVYTGKCSYGENIKRRLRFLEYIM